MRWKTGLISARMQNGADEIISFRKRKGFCKDLGQIWKLPGWQSEAPPLPGGEGAAQVRVALISLTFTQNQAPLVWTSAAIRAALINYFKDTGKKRGALPGKGTSLPGTINLLCACHMVNSVAQQNSPPWLSSSSRVAGGGGDKVWSGEIQRRGGRRNWKRLGRLWWETYECGHAHQRMWNHAGIPIRTRLTKKVRRASERNAKISAPAAGDGVSSPLSPSRSEVMQHFCEMSAGGKWKEDEDI